MVKELAKPKGRMSAYAYFVKSCREDQKRNHPGDSVGFSEFSKNCSEKWKNLAIKEKTRFEDLAKKDKARYDTEMETYVPPKGARRSKKKKDPNAPKRPPSAFFLFCSDHRPKIKEDHPGISIGDTAKKLGELWGQQGAKDRAPFEAKASKLKEKYVKEIAAYHAESGSAKGGKAKSGPGRPKAKPVEEDEDDEDEEEDEDEEDEEEEEDDE